MKELARASWILFQAHLWRTLRTKRGLVAGLLAAGPVGLAFVVSVISRFEGPPPQELLTSFIWIFLIQTIVPLVSLVLASAVIAEEIEDRTITYLFTRPIPRAAILLGRWLAVALPVVLLLCFSAELVLRLLPTTAGEGAEDQLWMPAGFHARTLATVAMGAAVYSALFAAAGALFKRPMLIGLGYTFVYEGFLGNLPGSTQKSTVVFYLKSYLFSPYPGMGGDVAEAIFGTPLEEPGKAVLMLALILLGILALGAWRFSRREYVLAA
jgi:ABC-2 type transport system permease protein